LPLDTQSYFSTKLTDMGVLDPQLAGIWTPESQLSSVPVGLTEQFTEHAGNYAAKYGNPAYFRRLIVRALALSGAQIGRTPRILDIGTGAGDNSVFPCLDLFENAEIIATDLSPNLLVLLRREVDRRCVADSVTVACADAMLDVFTPESFDLVTGMAILHHLIDPSRALVAAHRALKPGGFAMFFEPFEFGHSILTLVFERIMSEASLRADSLDPIALHFMHLLTEDVRRRLGRDKSSPIFHEVDDKWLFSESYFHEAGKAAGFEQVKIESIHDPNNQITSRAAALLSLGANVQLSSLPAWAQTIVAQADSAFSETRSEMIFEGIVTMRKPSGGG
jgi:ubiquinone/menaquinone biosynthesis C-methylase UbiE